MWTAYYYDAKQCIEESNLDIFMSAERSVLDNIFRKGVFLKAGLLLKRSDFIAYLKSLLSAFGKF